MAHTRRSTWCSEPLEQWNAQIDHVVPRAIDGKATNDNLVGSCADCNQRRPRGWKMPKAQLAAPLDLKAGRELALRWYPFMAARIEDNKRRKREARAARHSEAGRMAFP